MATTDTKMKWPDVLYTRELQEKVRENGGG
jgi:hypothetical protein